MTRRKKMTAEEAIDLLGGCSNHPYKNMTIVQAWKACTYIDNLMWVMRTLSTTEVENAVYAAAKKIGCSTHRPKCLLPNGYCLTPDQLRALLPVPNATDVRAFVRNEEPTWVRNRRRRA